METKLQEMFLSTARDTKSSVTLFLTNGYQLRGSITDFDDSVVVLLTDNKQQIIYKHVISTIVPELPLALAT